MKLQFFLISYLGRNKSLSFFCGIVVLLLELHCCETSVTEYSDNFICVFFLIEAKNLKSGLLTIDHLSIPNIQLMKRWHTISVTPQTRYPDL